LLASGQVVDHLFHFISFCTVFHMRKKKFYREWLTQVQNFPFGTVSLFRVSTREYDPRTAR
jgi:hypothetical protein